MKGTSVQKNLPIQAKTPYISWHSLQIFQSKWLLGHRGDNSWERQGWRPDHARSRVKLQPENGLREQRDQDCWAMTTDMSKKWAGAAQKYQLPHPSASQLDEGVSLVAFQIHVQGSDSSGLMEFLIYIYSCHNSYRAAKHQHSGSPLYVSAWQPASTFHLTRHSVVGEKMWPGLLPVIYWKCVLLVADCSGFQSQYV